MMASDQLVRGPDGAARCYWVGGASELLAYHDAEWGLPVAEDVRLFEKMILEAFQSGLSWLTILKKRHAFREAFSGFDFREVSRYGEADFERLLANTGIVRHRGKIASAIHNAGVVLDLVARYGSLAAYVWQFEPMPEDRPDRITWALLQKMSQTASSVALSQDLKRRGWRFFGPTTAYAFMQAVGMVNDHQAGCKCRGEVEAARAVFRRPSPSG